MIEMIAVVIVIALIATIIAPKMFTGLGKAKRDIARSKMGKIETAITEFYYDCGRYPTDEEGLNALLEAPSDLEDKWKKMYLKRSEILDPWGNPYEYMEEGERNIGSFDLISFGADGVEGGEENSNDEDIYND